MISALRELRGMKTKEETKGGGALVITGFHHGRRRRRLSLARGPSHFRNLTTVVVDSFPKVSCAHGGKCYNFRAVTFRLTIDI